jgi:hypothetical protein
MKRGFKEQPQTLRCPCGGTFNAGESCQRCSGDEAPEIVPPPAPKVPERLCTHEENMRGLAALKAAVFGKPGPMAREIDRVVARLTIATNKAGKDEVPF